MSNRTLVVQGFNMDQMLHNTVEKFEPFVSNFQFHQHCDYSSHNLGGILDLVFHYRIREDVSWIPCPYSDHFKVFIKLMYRD